ncbi:MAG: HlyD family efflux transporter periplasmic adaptor subunit [Ruminococcaceae bacterium]|nr:HlyD family efflux transporter periplasmic adaptor subunit [Oscillospiraceae bacterium]
MKKTIITLVLSFSLILGIMIADYMVNNNFVMANTEKVKVTEIKKYISALGVCHEQNKREIKIDMPFVVEDIYANVGDYIKKGQKIATLNKESLKSKLEYQSVTVSSVNNNSLIAKINNYNTEILSPISGIVTKINVTKGSEINPSVPVMVVSDLENMVIKSSVKEEDIKDIYVGQKVIISGNSFVGDVEGEVIKIYPLAEKSNTLNGENFVTVDVVAKNYDNIRPQTNLNLEFEDFTKKNAVIIPFDSVMFDEDKPYVYINNMGYAAKRYVKLGEEYDIDVEILGGVNEGDNLILNPKFLKIKEGDKLLNTNEV